MEKQPTVIPVSGNVGPSPFGNDSMAAFRRAAQAAQADQQYVMSPTSASYVSSSIPISKYAQVAYTGDVKTDMSLFQDSWNENAPWSVKAGSVIWNGAVTAGQIIATSNPYSIGAQLVTGLIEQTAEGLFGVGDKDFSIGELIGDNVVASSVDKVADAFKSITPIYAPSDYGNMSLFDRMTTAQFWNGVGEGLGFVYGAVKSAGVTTKQLGKISNAMSSFDDVGAFGVNRSAVAAANAQAKSRWANLAETMGMLNPLSGKIANQFANGEVSLGRLSGAMAESFAKASGLAANSQLTTSLIAHWGESQMEAMHFVKENKEQLIAQQEQKLNRKLTEEEIMGIEKDLWNTSVGVFGMNMMLLSATDGLAYSALSTGIGSRLSNRLGRATAGSMDSIARRSIFGRTTGEWYRRGFGMFMDTDQVVRRTLMSKTSKVMADFVRRGAVEGAQEFTQGRISKMALNGILGKYDFAGYDNTLSHFENTLSFFESMLQTGKDFANSATYISTAGGINSLFGKQEYSTDEKEEMMIGVMMGMLGGGFSGRNMSERFENTSLGNAFNTMMGRDKDIRSTQNKVKQYFESNESNQVAKNATRLHQMWAAADTVESVNALNEATKNAHSEEGRHALENAMLQHFIARDAMERLDAVSDRGFDLSDSDLNTIGITGLDDAAKQDLKNGASATYNRLFNAYNNAKKFAENMPNATDHEDVMEYYTSLHYKTMLNVENIKESAKALGIDDNATLPEMYESVKKLRRDINHTDPLISMINELGDGTGVFNENYQVEFASNAQKLKDSKESIFDLNEKIIQAKKDIDEHIKLNGDNANDPHLGMLRVRLDNYELGLQAAKDVYNEAFEEVSNNRVPSLFGMVERIGLSHPSINDVKKLIPDMENSIKNINNLSRRIAEVGKLKQTSANTKALKELKEELKTERNKLKEYKEKIAKLRKRDSANANNMNSLSSVLAGMTIGDSATTPYQREFVEIVQSINASIAEVISGDAATMNAVLEAISNMKTRAKNLDRIISELQDKDNTGIYKNVIKELKEVRRLLKAKMDVIEKLNDARIKYIQAEERVTKAFNDVVNNKSKPGDAKHKELIKASKESSKLLDKYNKLLDKYINEGVRFSNDVEVGNSSAVIYFEAQIAELEKEIEDFRKQRDSATSENSTKLRDQDALNRLINDAQDRISVMKDAIENYQRVYERHETIQQDVIKRDDANARGNILYSLAEIGDAYVNFISRRLDLYAASNLVYVEGVHDEELAEELKASKSRTDVVSHIADQYIAARQELEKYYFSLATSARHGLGIRIAGDAAKINRLLSNINDTIISEALITSMSSISGSKYARLAVPGIVEMMKRNEFETLQSNAMNKLANSYLSSLISKEREYNGDDLGVLDYKLSDTALVANSTLNKYSTKLDDLDLDIQDYVDKFIEVSKFRKYELQYPVDKAFTSRSQFEDAATELANIASKFKSSSVNGIENLGFTDEELLLVKSLAQANSKAVLNSYFMNSFGLTAVKEADRNNVKTDEDEKGVVLRGYNRLKQFVSQTARKAKSLIDNVTSRDQAIEIENDAEEVSGANPQGTPAQAEVTQQQPQPQPKQGLTLFYGVQLTNEELEFYKNILEFSPSLFSLIEEDIVSDPLFNAEKWAKIKLAYDKDKANPATPPSQGLSSKPENPPQQPETVVEETPVGEQKDKDPMSPSNVLIENMTLAIDETARPNNVSLVDNNVPATKMHLFGKNWRPTNVNMFGDENAKRKVVSMAKNAQSRNDGSIFFKAVNHKLASIDTKSAVSFNQNGDSIVAGMYILDDGTLESMGYKVETINGKNYAVVGFIPNPNAYKLQVGSTTYDLTSRKGDGTYHSAVHTYFTGHAKIADDIRILEDMFSVIKSGKMYNNLSAINLLYYLNSNLAGFNTNTVKAIDEYGSALESIVYNDEAFIRHEGTYPFIRVRTGTAVNSFIIYIDDDGNRQYTRIYNTNARIDDKKLSDTIIKAEDEVGESKDRSNMFAQGSESFAQVLYMEETFHHDKGTSRVKVARDIRGQVLDNGVNPAADAFVEYLRDVKKLPITDENNEERVNKIAESYYKYLRASGQDITLDEIKDAYNQYINEIRANARWNKTGMVIYLDGVQFIGDSSSQSEVNHNKLIGMILEDTGKEDIHHSVSLKIISKVDKFARGAKFATYYKFTDSGKLITGQTEISMYNKTNTSSSFNFPITLEAIQDANFNSLRDMLFSIRNRTYKTKTASDKKLGTIIPRVVLRESENKNDFFDSIKSYKVAVRTGISMYIVPSNNSVEEKADKAVQQRQNTMPSMATMPATAQRSPVTPIGISNEQITSLIEDSENVGNTNVVPNSDFNDTADQLESDIAPTATPTVAAPITTQPLPTTAPPVETTSPPLVEEPQAEDQTAANTFDVEQYYLDNKDVLELFEGDSDATALKQYLDEEEIILTPDQLGKLFKMLTGGAQFMITNKKENQTNIEQESMAVSLFSDVMIEGISDENQNILNQVLGNVAGAYTFDMIHLSKEGIAGRGYHELFHRIFRVRFPAKDRKKLYDKYWDSVTDDEVNNFKKDIIQNKKISFDNAKKLFIEEIYAEDFRRYLLAYQTDNAIKRYAARSSNQIIEGNKNIAREIFDSAPMAAIKKRLLEYVKGNEALAFNAFLASIAYTFPDSINKEILFELKSGLISPKKITNSKPIIINAYDARSMNGSSISYNYKSKLDLSDPKVVGSIVENYLSDFEFGGSLSVNTLKQFSAAMIQSIADTSRSMKSSLVTPALDSKILKAMRMKQIINNRYGFKPFEILRVDDTMRDDDMVFMMAPSFSPSEKGLNASFITTSPSKKALASFTALVIDEMIESDTPFDTERDFIAGLKKVVNKHFSSVKVAHMVAFVKKYPELGTKLADMLSIVNAIKIWSKSNKSREDISVFYPSKDYLTDTIAFKQEILTKEMIDEMARTNYARFNSVIKSASSMVSEMFQTYTDRHKSALLEDAEHENEEGDENQSVLNEKQGEALAFEDGAASVLRRVLNGIPSEFETIIDGLARASRDSEAIGKIGNAGKYLAMSILSSGQSYAILKASLSNKSKDDVLKFILSNTSLVNKSRDSEVSMRIMRSTIVELNKTKPGVELLNQFGGYTHTTDKVEMRKSIETIANNMLSHLMQYGSEGVMQRLVAYSPTMSAVMYAMPSTLNDSVEIEVNIEGLFTSVNTRYGHARSMSYENQRLLSSQFISPLSSMASTLKELHDLKVGGEIIDDEDFDSKLLTMQSNIKDSLQMYSALKDALRYRFTSGKLEEAAKGLEENYDSITQIFSAANIPIGAEAIIMMFNSSADSQALFNELSDYYNSNGNMRMYAIAKLLADGIRRYSQTHGFSYNNTNTQALTIVTRKLSNMAKVIEKYYDGDTSKRVQLINNPELNLEGLSTFVDKDGNVRKSLGSSLMKDLAKFMSFSTDAIAKVTYRDDEGKTKPVYWSQSLDDTIMVRNKSIDPAILMNSIETNDFDRFLMHFKEVQKYGTSLSRFPSEHTVVLAASNIFYHPIVNYIINSVSDNKKRENGILEFLSNIKFTDINKINREREEDYYKSIGQNFSGDKFNSTSDATQISVAIGLQDSYTGELDDQANKNFELPYQRFLYNMYKNSENTFLLQTGFAPRTPDADRQTAQAMFGTLIAPVNPGTGINVLASHFNIAMYSLKRDLSHYNAILAEAINTFTGVLPVSTSLYSGVHYHTFSGQTVDGESIRFVIHLVDRNPVVRGFIPVYDEYGSIVEYDEVSDHGVTVSQVIDSSRKFIPLILNRDYLKIYHERFLTGDLDLYFDDDYDYQLIKRATEDYINNAIDNMIDKMLTENIIGRSFEGEDNVPVYRAYKPVPDKIFTNIYVDGKSFKTINRSELGRLALNHFLMNNYADNQYSGGVSIVFNNDGAKLTKRAGASGSSSPSGVFNRRVSLLPSSKQSVATMNDGVSILSSRLKDGKVETDDGQTFGSIFEAVKKAIEETRLLSFEEDIRNIATVIVTNDFEASERLRKRNLSLFEVKPIVTGAGIIIKTGLAFIHRGQVGRLKPGKDNEDAAIDLYTSMIKASIAGDTSRVRAESLLLDDLYEALPQHKEKYEYVSFMERNNIDMISSDGANKGLKVAPLKIVSGKVRGDIMTLPAETVSTQVRMDTSAFKEEIIDAIQKQNLIWSKEENFEIIVGWRNGQPIKKMSKDVSDDYINSLAARTIRALNILIDELHKYNEDGTLVFMEKDVVDRFAEMAKSRARQDLEDLFMIERNGEKHYSFSEPMLKKTIESYVAAITKNIVKFKVPGSKYTLVSDALTRVVRATQDTVIDGMNIKAGQVIPDSFTKEHYNEFYHTVNGSIELKPGFESSKLHGHKQEDLDNGNILHVEAIIPQRIAAKFGWKSGETLALPDNVAYQLGIRIPVQGNFSMVALKVVDVSHSLNSSAVIIPPDFMILSGSDFDIDALYTYFIKTYGNNVDYGSYMMAKNEDEALSMAFNEMLASSDNIFGKIGSKSFSQIGNTVNAVSLIASANPDISAAIENHNDRVLAIGYKYDIMMGIPEGTVDKKNYKFVMDDPNMQLNYENEIKASEEIKRKNIADWTSKVDLRNVVKAFKESDRTVLLEYGINPRFIGKDKFKEVADLLRNYNKDSIIAYAQASDNSYIIDALMPGGEVVTKSFDLIAVADSMVETILNNYNYVDGRNMPLTSEEFDNNKLRMEMGMYANKGNEQAALAPDNTDIISKTLDALTLMGFHKPIGKIDAHNLGNSFELRKLYAEGKANTGPFALMRTLFEMLSEYDSSLKVGTKFHPVSRVMSEKFDEASIKEALQSANIYDDNKFKDIMNSLQFALDDNQTKRLLGALISVSVDNNNNLQGTQMKLNVETAKFHEAMIQHGFSIPTSVLMTKIMKLAIDNMLEENSDFQSESKMKDKMRFGRTSTEGHIATMLNLIIRTLRDKGFNDDDLKRVLDISEEVAYEKRKEDGKDVNVPVDVTFTLDNLKNEIMGIASSYGVNEAYDARDNGTLFAKMINAYDIVNNISAKDLKPDNSTIIALREKMNDFKTAIALFVHMRDVSDSMFAATSVMSLSKTQDPSVKDNRKKLKSFSRAGGVVRSLETITEEDFIAEREAFKNSELYKIAGESNNFVINYSENTSVSEIQLIRDFGYDRISFMDMLKDEKLKVVFDKILLSVGKELKDLASFKPIEANSLQVNEDVVFSIVQLFKDYGQPVAFSKTAFRKAMLVMMNEKYKLTNTEVIRKNINSIFDAVSEKVLYMSSDEVVQTEYQTGRLAVSFMHDGVYYSQNFIATSFKGIALALLRSPKVQSGIGAAVYREILEGAFKVQDTEKFNVLMNKISVLSLKARNDEDVMEKMNTNMFNFLLGKYVREHSEYRHIPYRLGMPFVSLGVFSKQFSVWNKIQNALKEPRDGKYISNDILNMGFFKIGHIKDRTTYVSRNKENIKISMLEMINDPTQAATQNAISDVGQMYMLATSGADAATLEDVSRKLYDITRDVNTDFGEAFEMMLASMSHKELILLNFVMLMQQEFLKSGYQFSSSSILRFMPNSVKYSERASLLKEFEKQVASNDTIGSIFGVSNSMLANEFMDMMIYDQSANALVLHTRPYDNKKGIFKEGLSTIKFEYDNSISKNVKSFSLDPNNKFKDIRDKKGKVVKKAVDFKANMVTKTLTDANIMTKVRYDAATQTSIYSFVPFFDSIKAVKEKDGWSNTYQRFKLAAYVTVMDTVEFVSYHIPGRGWYMLDSKVIKELSEKYFGDELINQLSDEAYRNKFPALVGTKAMYVDTPAITNLSSAFNSYLFDSNTFVSDLNNLLGISNVENKDGDKSSISGVAPAIARSRKNTMKDFGGIAVSLTEGEDTIDSSLEKMGASPKALPIIFTGNGTDPEGHSATTIIKPTSSAFNLLLNAKNNFSAEIKNADGSDGIPIGRLRVESDASGKKILVSLPGNDPTKSVSFTSDFKKKKVITADFGLLSDYTKYDKPIRMNLGGKAYDFWTPAAFIFAMKYQSPRVWDYIVAEKDYGTTKYRNKINALANKASSQFYDDGRLFYAAHLFAQMHKYQHNQAFSNMMKNSIMSNGRLTDDANNLYMDYHTTYATSNGSNVIEMLSLQSNLFTDTHKNKIRTNESGMIMLSNIHSAALRMFADDLNGGEGLSKYYNVFKQYLDNSETTIFERSISGEFNLESIGRAFKIEEPTPSNINLKLQTIYRMIGETRLEELNKKLEELCK